ncbi:MAG: protein kinase [Planctomycetota bacterium]
MRRNSIEDSRATVERRSHATTARPSRQLAHVNDKTLGSEIGHHRLIRTVGIGGMGIVYAAKDLQTDREVALKVVNRKPAPILPDEAAISTQRRKKKDRFVTEVRATATLDHPNIVTVYSADRTDEFAYYTMQLIDGVDLRHFINEAYEFKALVRQPQLGLKDIDYLLKVCGTNKDAHADATRSGDASIPVGPQSTDEFDSLAELADAETANGELLEDTNQPCGTNVKPCFSPDAFAFLAERAADAADAIAHANAEGILHRDIKPSNLIIDRHGKIFVTDFGLAKLVREENEDSTACVGTVGYIAPECLKAADSVDYRSEVYSFGCVLLQLMTLREAKPPEPGDDQFWQTDVVRALPIPLRTIIRTAMAKSPEDRYQTVADLVTDLRQFAKENAAEVADQIVAEHRLRNSVELTSTTSKRNRTWVTVAAAAVVGLLLIPSLLVLFRPNRDATEQRRLEEIAALARAESQRADSAVELLLGSLQSLYLQAAGDLGAQRMASSQTKKLTAETRAQLTQTAKVCNELAAQPGQRDETIADIASMLRKIAFVFDSRGDAVQAVEHYGDAADVLDKLDASRPNVIAEKCWLRYLQTRRRQHLQGFSLQADRYEEIAEEAEELLRRPEVDLAIQSRIHELMGMIDLARERYGDAAEHLASVTEPEFDQNHLKTTLVTALRMGEQFEKAMPLAKELVEESPQSDEAWRNLAGLHLHLDNVPDALDAFGECVRLNGTNPLGWQGLAWAQYRNGQTSLAIESINQAANLAPKHDGVLTSRARFYSSEGRYDEAAADFRQALTLRPQSSYVAFPALVTLMLRSRSTPADHEFCRRIIDAHSQSWPEPMVLELMAIMALKEHDYERSSQLLSEIPQPNPTVQLLQRVTDMKREHDPARREEIAAELRARQVGGWKDIGDWPIDRLIISFIEALCEEELSVSHTAP